MTTKDTFSVFYAWQSDKPAKHCKLLIRAALDAAAKSINEDADAPFEVKIDQDTEGVTGLCDIPATILEKVASADAFVCDLTYIAKTEPDEGADDDSEFSPRFCSNPNVLLELGVAFHAIGWERLIPVMNECYGPVAKQIFDLAHRRRPVSYTYPNNDGATGKSTINKLGREFEQIIRDVMIAHGIRDSAPDENLERSEALRSDFQDAVCNNKFHNLEREGGAIAITIAPATVPKLSFEAIRRQHLSPPSHSRCAGWTPETRGNSVLAPYDHPLRQGADETVRCGLAELTTQGVVRAADAYVLDQRFLPLKEDIIPSGVTEATIVRTVQRYLAILRELDVPLPWYIGVSILQIRGYYFLASNRETSRQPFDRDNMVLDTVIVKDVDGVEDEKAVATLLREQLDFIWREFGFSLGSMTFQNDVWSPGC